MDQEEFYLTSDNDYLISVFEQELAFIRNNWFYSGRPTMVIILTKSRMGELNPYKGKGPLPGIAQDAGSIQPERKNLFNLLTSLRSGTCNGVRVRLSRLVESINTSCIESLDFLQHNSHHSKTDISPAVFSSFKHSFGLSNVSKKLQFSEKATKGSKPKKRPALTGSDLTQPISSGGPYTASTPGSDTAPYSSLEHSFNETANQAPNGANLNSTLYKLKHEMTADSYSALNRRRGNSVQANHEPSQLNADPVQVDATQPENTPISLVPGDPSAVPTAISMLLTSTNLYDQIDLLHYLVSVHGLEYNIPALSSTLHNLLDEVYMKSITLKLWDITRQAAGLLRKVVNSLTINVTDVVIRLKHITIGSAIREFIIDGPMGPEVLAGKIFEYW
jgi:hypothetical protein